MQNLLETLGKETMEIVYPMFHSFHLPAWFLKMALQSLPLCCNFFENAFYTVVAAYLPHVSCLVEASREKPHKTKMLWASKKTIKPHFSLLLMVCFINQIYEGAFLLCSHSLVCKLMEMGEGRLKCLLSILKLSVSNLLEGWLSCITCCRCFRVDIATRASA